MDLAFKDAFLTRWTKYFGTAELPITFSYVDDPGAAELAPIPTAPHECVLTPLAQARHGRAIVFDVSRLGCMGARRYFGFSQELSPTFDYFLSCGIPGKVEGERYKKSPELVREYVKRGRVFEAPKPYLSCNRWDGLTETDHPDVVAFFAQPDVLSGLFTLANFDEPDPDGVFCPFCAGCGALVQYPFLEQSAAHPRAVLGNFDVSARPYVPSQTLSFSVPMKKFERMVANMDESFLITPSWQKVRRRIV